MSIAYCHHFHNYVLPEQLLLRLAKKWSAGVNIEDALLAPPTSNDKRDKPDLEGMPNSQTKKFTNSRG
jgi:hypothetical protein